ncbi:MAG: trigger factor [Deltaproteobacteria bacterium]|nr:MAG: trigger factor [Deltaproteobacteria bacterium]
MQVSVEELSSVKKVLHIEIPEDEVTRELEDAYKTLKKTAKIKGFRPGKVPRSVLERLYKKNVDAEVSSKLIQESFSDAIRENSLTYLGNPLIDPPELKPKEPYKYDATIETSPEIEDIDYQGMTIKKTLYQISEEEVDAQIRMLQKSLAKKELVEEDRPVRRDDFITIDYEGFKDGKPFAEIQKTENHILKVGAGEILEGFDEKLIGMMPDEKKEIDVQFPETHPNGKLANQEITFQVHVKDIRKEVLPEIDEAFLKNFRYETLEDIKKEIRENLKQGYDKRVEQELNEQIFSGILEKNDFEIPDIMVQYELDSILSEIERSFAYRGTSMEELGLTKEKLSAEYRETAVKQVKRHLILGKLIEQEGLSVSDEELDKGLEDMANALHKSVDEVKEHYKEKKEELEYFKHALLEKRVISLMIENSTVEEVEPDPVQETENMESSQG